MRIDEFSAPAQIDGTLTVTERTRFMLFGFDIAIAAAVPEHSREIALTLRSKGILQRYGGSVPLFFRNKGGTVH